MLGRNLIASSSATATSYIAYNIKGVFEATQATHYVGFTFKNDTTNGEFTIERNNTYKLLFYFHEIMGDVLT